MRRIVGFLAGLVGAGVALVLALYLYQAGLDDADKIASVVGAFVAIASLAVSVASFGGLQSPTKRTSTITANQTVSAGETISAPVVNMPSIGERNGE